MPGFGECTIEQLIAMVANFSPETVEARGTALVKAAGDIKAIGEILKSHRVSGWEGEASTAFQDWVSQAGSATLRLSEYSATGGKYMVEAGQTMREVRRDMPKQGEVEPELANYAAAEKFHNDPDAQPIARASWQKLEQHRMAAVQQLEKLTTSYKQSAYQMNTAEIPTFPPPPANFVPRVVDAEGAHWRSDGGSATSVADGSAYGTPGRPVASSKESTGVAVQRPRSSDTVSVSSPSGTENTSVSAVPERDLKLDLNHVGTTPDRTLPSALGAGPVGPGDTAVASGGAMPSVSPPVTGLLKPGGGLGKVGGGMFPGTGGLSGRTGGVAGLPPRDAGIFGGRPVSGGGASAGIPRGTVIGAEGGQMAGRGVMGGVGGGGGSHGASGGFAASRRLATEMGGVAGGRPPAAGGCSATGGQPFTPGGSGLVRGTDGAGPFGATAPAGAGAQSPFKRRGGQGGERPDYLTEDEETWQADRRVVPPVID